jgi:O-antigen/teichoic acid export membrane protein
MVNSRRAMRSAFWTSLEAGGLALVSFITLIAFTHLLSPAQMGLFAVALAVTEIIALVVTQTFHDALVQRAVTDDADYDCAFTVTMIVSLLLCGGALVANPWISRLMTNPEAGPVLAWLALSFPLSGLSATIIARQRRELAFRSLAVRSLVGRVMGAVVGVGAALAGLGLWSLVLQQLTMAGLSTAVLWILAEHRPRFRLRIDRIGALIRFGIASLGAQMLNFSLKRLFVVVVGGILGATAAGYVNVAFRTIDTFWSLSVGAVQQVALPMLSRLQGDEIRLRRAYFAAVRLSCAMLYPCFIGLALVSEDLVGILFGSKWAPAAPYLSALACLTILQVPRMFVTPMLVAQGRPYDVMPAIAAEIGLMFALFFGLGIPHPGYAIGIWIICEVAQTPFAGAMLWRRTGLTLIDQGRGVLTPLISVIVLAAAIGLVRHFLPATCTPIIRLFVCMSVGGLTYPFTLALIDRTLVREILHRVAGAIRKADAASA